MRWNVVDRRRILSKIDELDSYLKDLRKICPVSFRDYQKIEKKRSCERLLQLSVECVIDICKSFVGGLKLGMPSEERDVFDKMFASKLISKNIVSLLSDMRAFRNLLVPEYAKIDDSLVFEKLKNDLSDFDKIKKALLQALAKHPR